MSNKLKLIIVSTFFPPYNHIASRRIYAFANYLSDFYEVTVITYTENKSFNEKSDKFSIIYLDNGYLDQLVKLKDDDAKFLRLSKIVIRKTLIYFNKKFFRYLEEKILQNFKIFLNAHQVDYVLSSFMPIEAHDVCYDVLTSSEKYKDIFWITDMRDEMSEHTSLNESQKNYYQELEIKYAKRANLVTAVSKPILKQFEKNMPNVGNFLEIRNGYDHNVETFHEYSPKLKIGYWGNFYSDRKPTNFLKLCQKLVF